MTKKRKSPIHHQVHSHIKKGTRVSSYNRGSGAKKLNSFVKKRVVKTEGHKAILNLSDKEKERRFYVMIRSGKVKIYQGSIRSFDKEIVPLLYDLNISGYMTTESGLAHTKNRPLQQTAVIFFKESYPKFIRVSKKEIQKRLPANFKIAWSEDVIEVIPPNYSSKVQRKIFYDMIKKKTKAKPGTVEYMKDVGELSREIMIQPETYGFVSNEDRKIVNKAFVEGIKVVLEKEKLT